MNLFKTLKRINFSAFWLLLKLGFQHPLFLYPTYKATKHCMQVATQYFGRKHYQNGQANAFRHAYWNYAIAKYCTYWSKNENSILKWTKELTDWHENAFRNRHMARLMDFHNNSIGRNIFKEHGEREMEFVCELLLQMTAQSVKITTETEATTHRKQLVHITEDQ